MRRFVLVLALAATACSGVDAVPGDMPSAEAEPVTSGDTTTTDATHPPTTPVAPTTSTTVDPVRTLIAWMPGGLVPEFGQLLESVEGIHSVTVARTGTLHITGTSDAAGAVVDSPPDGFVIPVEAVVIDPETYRTFVPAAIAGIFSSLTPTELVLSEASAELRRLGVGGTIRLGGDTEFSVAAIVPDEVLGSIEIAITSVEAISEDNTIPRYALVESSVPVAAVESALLGLLPEESRVRVRDRDPDRSDAARAVQPQIVIKQLFGEFAYRPPRRGTRLEIDPAWVADNIVAVNIPLLGSTRCHKKYAELLTEVMQGLVDDGLEDVVDRSAFRGCWNPRYIAGTTRLSRHAFGAAADINFGNSLAGGPGSPVHPELLARMAAAGITSGHTWSAPDPGHFEYYGDEPLVSAE